MFTACKQVCGYSEVISPQIFKRSLWETSGHWQVKNTYMQRACGARQSHAQPSAL
jgi:threonyl-tRNA synthetase